MEYLKKMTGCGTIIGLFAVFLLLNSLPLSEAQSDPCKDVNCGKGQCVDDPSQLLVGFRCNCETGWSQITSMFPALPCFVPNCTLNFSCAGSPAAAPSSTLVHPAGFLPSLPPLSSLSWCVIPGVCGSGDCSEIPSDVLGVLPSYKCDCHKGSSNLLNQTTGPCLPDCAVSGSCAALNIPLTPSPPSSQNGTSGPAPSQNEGFAPSSNPNPPSHAVNNSSCEHVDCWEGTCAPAPNLPWLPQYNCYCEHGWFNLLNISYLACGLPNCEVSNPSCGMLSHPPSITLPSIQDILNPCSLSLCGDGRCVSTNKSGFLGIEMPSYSCICNDGASNLLKKSSGMCVPDDCIPQCLAGLGWGKPPSTGGDPFGEGPLALSPDSSYSARPGRKQEARLGNAFAILTILATQFW